MRPIYISVILVLSVLGDLFAQDQDTETRTALSPDTASIYYVYLNNRWPGEKLTLLVDTSLVGIQYYIPTESSQSINALNGNAGLSYKSLIFSPEPSYGFRYAPVVFYNYLFRNDNVPFYHIRNPYSFVFYSTGKGKEQIFDITHAQNLSRGITLGVDLKIINSLGTYLRQKSDDVKVALQGQFVTDNERYVVLANYRNNRMRWRENGGITYDSLFTQNIETDRKRISVNLTAADNQIKESGFFLRQFYYFGRKSSHQDVNESIPDSLDIKQPADSLHRFYDPARTNFFRHTFSYTRNSFLYKDSNPRSGFYSDIYADSTITYDSVYFHEIINDLSFEGGVGRIKGAGKALLLRAGIEYSFSVYRNDSISKKFTRLMPYAYLSANAFGIAKAEGRIWLSQGNPFNGDKGIAAKLTLPGYDNTDSWGNITASVAVDALQPDYLFQFHYSNHFKWENTFGQQTIFSGKSMYENKHLKLGYNIYHLTGWVYFNDEAKPTRDDGSFSVNQIWGQAMVRAGRFDFEAFGTWQKVTDTTVLHLPEIAGRATACFSIPLFKRALYFRAGLSVLYNSAFYADEYMPALRSYYLQSTVKTGNYPYVDAFINLRVKRARLYLLMKHLNSGFGEYNYMMIPGYPMPDRGFRFGVSWTFYD